MLGNAAAVTMLPAVDLDRAIRYYTDVLGLKPVDIGTPPEAGLAAFTAGGGTQLALYLRGATKADHTVLTFIVADIEAELDALVSKGVKFEQYNLPDFGLVTDARGIAELGGTKNAWFKDTEGNLLALAEM